MTNRQEYILEKVREQIRNARMMLDDVLYRTDDLDEDERKKIRGAYDDLCSANDKL